MVKDLVLLERHYIGGKLAANFRFTFPAFIPKSENKVEFIYEIPKLSPKVETWKRRRSLCWKWYIYFRRRKINYS